MLWLYECLQHRILGMVNRTNVRQLLEPPNQIIICYHQDASLQVKKHDSHLRPVPHTAWEMAALLEQCGWECLKHPLHSPDLAPNNFHIFSPLKKHLSIYRFQMLQQCKKLSTVVPFAKSRILHWSHTFTDNTRWQMPEPLGWQAWESRPLLCFLVRNVFQ
jgi:hypothetical protein